MARYMARKESAEVSAWLLAARGLVPVKISVALYKPLPSSQLRPTKEAEEIA